jgi:hypothetical protein
MATPIKDIPILYGKDAERFKKNMKEAETKKASKEEIERVKADFEEYNAMYVESEHSLNKEVKKAT